MVEVEVETKPDEASRVETAPPAPRARNLGFLHDAVAWVVALVHPPVKVLGVLDDLPTEPGLYLFKGPNLSGTCAHVRGLCRKLETYIDWNARSAYVVGSGALWRTVLPSGTPPQPDQVLPPSPDNNLDFPPRAAAKL